MGIAAQIEGARERVTYHAPDGLKSGREVGAWAYGVACGLYTELREGDERQLLVEMKAEHLDGAACSIVAAGGAVARARETTTYPAAPGNGVLIVSLGAAL